MRSELKGASKLFVVIFQTGFCAAPAVLELILYTSPASNSQGSACLFLSSAGVKGVYYHAWLSIGFLALSFLG